MKYVVAPVASVLLLAACGGSGGGINTGNAEADILVASAQSIYESFDAIDQTDGYSRYSAVGNESGNVSYNGVASFVAGTGYDSGSETIDYVAIGSFTATADFGPSQDVTGVANGFFEVSNPEIANDENASLEDIRVAGPINGQFDFDLEIEDFFGDAVAVGTVTGTLTHRDGFIEDFDAGIDAFGDFYGDNLEVLDVYATGVVPGTGDFAAINVTGLRPGF
jgi:hypothetical protein